MTTCNYFTHYSDGLNLCLAFADCVTLAEQDCTDCISGEKTCSPGGAACDVQGACNDVLTGLAEAAKRDECLQACKENPE